MEWQSHEFVPIEEESVERWRCGHGGFGSVYKAKHKVLKTDVAIKWLNKGANKLEMTALFREAIRMKKFSCPYVVWYYGPYEGYRPGTTSMEMAIVMEFMENGSIASLQKALSCPPPWPLAFSFANQIARGMNFLHSSNFLHQDLKPDNVLLDENLKAKIADFGLCRPSTSCLASSMETPEDIGGSYKYKPPEAFEDSYQPVRSFDVYSYGILLWSIITGKEPYPDYNCSQLDVMVRDRKRPPLEEIDQDKAEGLRDLVDLMQKCWQGEPSDRPAFEDMDDMVFKKHPMEMRDVVNEVLKKLHPATIFQPPNASPPIDPSNVRPQSAEDAVDLHRFIDANKESAASFAEGLSDAAKAKFVKDKMQTLVKEMSRVMRVVDALRDIVDSENYQRIQVAKPSQNRVRELYRLCLQTEKSKAAFYDALMTHQADLMKSLGA